jgi:hypothetical protein
MSDVTLSLVAHTNVGKTTLARTLLGRDIGEVRDAPHVTEFASLHELVASPEGDHLRLADTPGFGDSARLVRRMRGSSQPLGWLLSQVWDRWRDRAFWASQQALRHVQAETDVVLYLVNAAESPAAAGYVASEMELLAWMDRPVLVLLNQLGAPRTWAEEQAETQAWRDHLARWPRVRAVLPLDAFARCWVHEYTLLQAVQTVLTGDAATAMARLTAAWQAQRQATFEAAMQVLAQSLARTALARQPAQDAGGIADRVRQVGAALTGRDSADPAAAAQALLLQEAQREARDSTSRLLQLHGLQGQAQDEIMARVDSAFAVRERMPEGRAAMLGGALTGAITGLKADVLSGGLTLGGGMLAGGILGALGAAGIARGVNLVRGTDHSWVRFSDDAMGPLLQAAVLRYLAVAHFGRGRGDWVQGEAPPHWLPVVADALGPSQPALRALWAGRERAVAGGDAATAQLAGQLRPLLHAAARASLLRLYPGSVDRGSVVAVDQARGR